MVTRRDSQKPRILPGRLSAFFLLIAPCLALLGCTTGNHLPPYPPYSVLKKENFSEQIASGGATLGMPYSQQEESVIQPVSFPQPSTAEPTPTETHHPATPEVLAAPMPAPLHPGGGHLPEDALVVDFSSVLSLAVGNNMQIAFARERINEAYAQLQEAKVLWLPTIGAGVNWNKHEGHMQDVEGLVFPISRSSLNAGLGTFTVGAGSPAIPGLLARFHLKDAIFEPKINEAVTAARHHAATAATNDTLLAVSLAYLELLNAEQERAIAVEIETKAQELANLTAEFARTGQGPQADADRAQTELSLRKNAVARADERKRVAAARLRELVRIPQDVPLLLRESTLVPIELLPPAMGPRDLIFTGLTTRPELAENRQLVQAAAHRLKSDKLSPWIPSLILGVSHSVTGGSPSSALRDFGDRFDLDAVAFWQVRNLGFGERAIQAASRSRLQQAQFQEIQFMDRVAREIVEFHAQVEVRRGQIAVAEKAVAAAVDSYRRNMERIRQVQGLPIEALQSIQALDQAQREYLRTLVDYNEAQFRLHWALGWPTKL